MTGNSITGRKESIAYDFYETPKWATEKAVRAMLRDEILSKKEYVYEPCVGAGAITDVLEKYEFENIKASDIQTADYIKGMKGVDVYEVEDNACDVVITNPPYNLMTIYLHKYFCAPFRVENILTQVYNKNIKRNQTNGGNRIWQGNYRQGIKL